MAANQVTVNYDGASPAQTVRFSSTMRVTTNDHNDLKNRDAPDQHPISSITGLQEQIDSKLGKESIEALSNLEIEEIINSLN